MRALLAAMAAMVDMLIEAPACFLASALLMRRRRGEPVGLFDAGAAVAVLALIAWLTARAARRDERSYAGWGRIYRLPRGSHAPTVSWAHLATASAWIALGVALWELFGGFVFVAAPLLLIRGAIFARRPR